MRWYSKLIRWGFHIQYSFVAGHSKPRDKEKSLHKHKDIKFGPKQKLEQTGKVELVYNDTGQEDTGQSTILEMTTEGAESVLLG